MIVPSASPSRSQRAATTLLVGREREQTLLRDRLTAACAGSGGLVLIGGEAGVGKTALADDLAAEAERQGFLVLGGRCYDLTETPPYGPWTEARSQFPPIPGSPPGSISPLPDAWHTDARSPQQFFAEVRAFFATAAMKQPLLLVLDDLQWADSTSLDLLRFIARALATLPFLLVANYRPDGLEAHHPFSQLIPLLVRESRAERIALAPLPVAALQTLVRARYRLGAVDERSLVAYLARRTEGNALFATEMLRALEERGIVATGGVALGDLEGVAVPPLLRQIVMGRVARLGPEAERLLGIAAVIGPQVRLDVWMRVGEADDETVEAVAEQALAVRLLVETREGVAFAHALIREALYEALPAMRRRRLHRAAGDAVAAGADPTPDVVAYHFQAAKDRRAATWLLRAGWQAYRAFAHTTARERFEAALPWAEGAERARVLLALARLYRYREQGMWYAEEAVEVARAAGEEVLAAVARFRLGVTLGYHERIGEALRAVEAAGAYLDTLPDTAMVAVSELTGLTLSRGGRRQDVAYLLAVCGRWREAQPLLDDPPKQLASKGMAAIARLGALLGHPDMIRTAIADCIRLLTQEEDDLGILVIQILEGALLLLPFLMDNEDARQQHKAAIAVAAERGEEILGAAPVLIGRCGLLIVAGKWAEAEAHWARRDEAFFGSLVVWDRAHVGGLTRAQGKRDEAWALVHDGVPDGPLTEPGMRYFATLDLYVLAARLALDEGDHARARQWLEAHDRWLNWAGEEVRWGRADGQLAWAEYHRTLGDYALALQHAEQALAEASTPRQPLALLAAHRLLGALATDAGKFAAAADSLQTALALADACAAPYERALTLLALAELHAGTGDAAAAQRLLTEAGALCAPLGARQALDRADRLAGRLTHMGGAPTASPAGLSTREAEVLRLIAAGQSNPEIAATLSLSVRTIERHIENLYRKIAVHGRAEAIAYAFRHDLA